MKMKVFDYDASVDNIAFLIYMEEQEKKQAQESNKDNDDDEE